MTLNRHILYSWILPGLSVAIGAAALLSIPYSYGAWITKFSIGQLLWDTWMHPNGELFHGAFVVPICCYIVWQMRGQLFRQSTAFNPFGALGLLAALVIYYAGYRGDIFFLGQFAVWLYLVSCILFIWGWRVLWMLSFPLGFLWFCSPPPGLENAIALPLRLAMSQASVFILNLIGIDCIRSGTGILSAPDMLLGIPAGQKFSVDVADPCSGIRSLFGQMMASSLYAYFIIRGFWKKWVLFLSSIPLSVVGNLVRILTLTLGTVVFGSEFAIGKNPLTDPSWFHMAAGYLVLLVAAFGLIAFGWLLNGGAAGIWRKGHLAFRNWSASRRSVTPPSSTAPVEHRRSDLY